MTRPAHLEALPLSQFLRGVEGAEPETVRSYGDPYLAAIVQGFKDASPVTSRSPTSYARAERLARGEPETAAWDATRAKLYNEALTPSERARLFEMPPLLEESSVPAHVERAVQREMGRASSRRTLPAPATAAPVALTPATKRPTAVENTPPTARSGITPERTPRRDPAVRASDDVPKYVQRARAQAAKSDSAWKSSEHTCKRDALVRALDATDWNKRQAALRLGMSRDGLYRAMARVGLPTVGRPD